MRGRLASIQTGNPYKLRIIHTEPGTHEDERDLHRQFRRYRLVGEWFTPGGELCERFPTVIAEWEDVTPHSVAYDRGFEDGWEQGFDDGMWTVTPCETCGETFNCYCPATPRALLREERRESWLAQKRYRVLHGTTRGMGRKKGAVIEEEVA